MSGTDRQLTRPAEKLTWYVKLINILASLVILGFWYLVSWVWAKIGWAESQEQCLMWIVAGNLALHLHKVRHND